MYPDLRDVELCLREMKVTPQPKPEDIWQEVVLVRSFLNEARGRCYNHGRHQFILATELKSKVETFIQRSVSDHALQVAMKMQRLVTKPSKADKQLLVKLPPLDRFEEARDQWNQHQRKLEQEIKAELERVKAGSLVRAGY
jgi:hypothetical protein